MDEAWWFWARVEPTGFCWNWTGPPMRTGYGQLQRKGRHHYAHRMAYELLVGPIPDGLHIDHLCRNRLCVNPDHLEPVESGENTRRGYAPGIVAARLGLCYRGHELSGSNVYHRPSGGRCCRRCAGLPPAAYE